MEKFKNIMKNMKGGLLIILLSPLVGLITLSELIEERRERRKRLNEFNLGTYTTALITQMGGYNNHFKEGSIFLYKDDGNKIVFRFEDSCQWSVFNNEDELEDYIKNTYFKDEVRDKKINNIFNEN